jgi:hypothetical protein
MSIGRAATLPRVFLADTLALTCAGFPCVSQVIEVVSADMKEAITSRKGLRLVMAAASKDKMGEVDAASVCE